MKFSVCVMANIDEIGFFPHVEALGYHAVWVNDSQTDRHFRTHEFHYTYLHPGEAELIDDDLIRSTCLVGTADELIERIRELERQGLKELMFATGVDQKWRFAEELARHVMARL